MIKRLYIWLWWKYIKKFNEIKLSNFLKNINNDYLKEELKENNILFYSFTYLIYRCFIFYKNSTSIKNAKNELGNINPDNLNIEYLSVIELSKTRLEHLDDINLVTFKKYKNMLDKFFSILDKKKSYK